MREGPVLNNDECFATGVIYGLLLLLGLIAGLNRFLLYIYVYKSLGNIRHRLG